jgi:hypothetical protein
VLPRPLELHGEKQGRPRLAARNRSVVRRSIQSNPSKSNL